MITAELTDAIGLITLRREERRNALDLDHCRVLADGANELVGKGARVLVLTGEGTTFCAGADLDGAYNEEFRTALYQALHGICALPIPVIASVNGPAVGAGTQLAIATDLRVAAPSAFFSVPTAQNGLAVDPWTVRRLALLGGGGPARAMLLGCEQLSAVRARELGMVDRIGTLDDALTWAAQIATMAPLSLGYSKRALNSLFEETDGDDQLNEEFIACWRSEDVAEARLARQERRTPQFRGR
ncbi:enoyl-CoA hydratase [Streptomyces sp. DSM 41524]|uniref:Enoyl-CoA hydratase n=1 Tax=Streptomyces asiaticus subsp. ignotus TaxID=3098222 RepID=A0ABU7Q9L5_9ACTN|nr:enoyl-CoA hydratase [Streptomyces sp. DSM 41524]